MRRVPTLPALAAVLAAVQAAPVRAQDPPLGLSSARGLTVTPAFEGWYYNPDGSITLSFGYYNRNTEEIVDVPLGPANAIEPAAHDGFQPTRFYPGRHWGVFGVRVPADFPEDEKVYWTLENRGETFRVPGHVNTDWQIDALAGEAGSGNTPPALAMGPDGPEGAGPGGPVAGPLSASVGEPLAILVWAEDDGKPSTSIVSRGRENVPVTLTWFVHQGLGEVRFSEESAEVPVQGDEMTTTVTFDAPGDYVLRVRANDASGVAGAGHAQCCWTNGFVKVRVTDER